MLQQPGNTSIGTGSAKSWALDFCTIAHSEMSHEKLLRESARKFWIPVFFLWWRTSSFCWKLHFFRHCKSFFHVKVKKLHFLGDKYYRKTTQNYFLWIFMHFITLLTHMYLDYSQVGNVKYQITKRVIVISMTNFLQIILNLTAYRFIAQYHTVILTNS